MGAFGKDKDSPQFPGRGWINWAIGGGTVFGIFLLVLFFGMLFTTLQGEVIVAFDPLGGGIRSEEYTEGLHIKAPWVRIDRFNVKIQEYSMVSVAEEGEVVGRSDTVQTVTSEGLYVGLDMTILYRIDPTKADVIRQTIGREGEYQTIIVRPNARSVIREVVSRYEAADIYGQGRAMVEAAIEEDLSAVLEKQNIIVESVLLRDVVLPSQITKAIEAKKEAEQEALRMVHVISKERLEADRKVIEAGGISEANEIISGSLTTAYLQWYWIESLENHESVIYMPSEGGLPLFKNIDEWGD